MKEKMTAIIKAQIDGAEVTFNDVTKENGVVLHGVSIRENDEQICPCIYYDPDSVTDENVEEITNGIVNTYFERKQDIGGVMNFKDTFMNVDYVKDNVFPYVLDYDANEAMIKESGFVFKKVLNLAVLYRIKVPWSDGNASFKVSYNHLDVIGITPKELDDYAFVNAKNDLFVGSIREILVESLKKECKGFAPNDEFFDEMFGDEDDFMKVYTNSNRWLGAASMLIPNMFSEKCYILPSSIHEVIVIPANDDISIEELKDMVLTVNVTEVSQQEKLADHVYYYNGKSLEIAA